SESTYSSALATIKRELDAAGDPNPVVSANWILRETLGISGSDMILKAGDLVDGEQAAALESALARRLSGEPLQYITGIAPFRYLDLEARPGVFIPRPETEVAVTQALECIEALHAAGMSDAPEVLDLCCGSGTIAVSIASECANASVTAVDISADAVELTKANARRAGVSERIAVMQGDLFEPLGNCNLFDIVVSNPPYIPSSKLSAMPREVIDYEPMLALDGGEDGLDTFRLILARLHEHIAFGGCFICELDEDALDTAVQLCKSAPNIAFDDVRIVDDLAGRPRVLVARASSKRLKVGFEGDERAFCAAKGTLDSSAAVVFPTDTVFGIGVKAVPGSNPDLLFEIKRRPKESAIPWLIGDPSDLLKYGKRVPEHAKALANAFWPGPLTLVVEASDEIGSEWLADDRTIAIRCPNSDIARRLIAIAEAPLATTSANISGRGAVADPSELDPELVEQVPIVLEAGAIESGTPSTIVSCLGNAPIILREGGIAAEDVESAIAALE
ncbi:MAG: peptide chain release factor N(5)-glutamine methyltransferase, partial [Coriobacteriales bacterium]|nr:peptide chain release factor N(5)-glutamine methyltransferase [Coriobacteriales bacterium]